jgi:hypothetical protein
MLVLALMTGPAFAISLKLNMCSPPQSPTAPCLGDSDDTEITIFESDFFQVDVWLVDYTETESIDGIDYYFYWDTISLSVGNPIMGDDWDEEFAFKYETEGIYEMGVSSMLGNSPAGGNTLLHTFILHCDAAGDGEISARQEDGGVYGTMGGDWDMGDIHGVVHQIEKGPCMDDADCDNGIYCDGAENCVEGDCQNGPDPCPGQSCSETQGCYTPSTTTIPPPVTTVPPGPISTTTVGPSTTTTERPTPDTTTTAKKCSCLIKKIYGEYSEETELLKYLRDNQLNQNPEGRGLIRLYYEWGPVIAEVMEKDEVFKENVKEMIDGILQLIEEETK